MRQCGGVAGVATPAEGVVKAKLRQGSALSQLCWNEGKAFPYKIILRITE